MKNSKIELQKFAFWVARQVCTREVSADPEAFEELARRKLKRMGFIRADGKNWIVECDDEGIE